jgi:hypothetical protein
MRTRTKPNPSRAPLLFVGIITACGGQAQYVQEERPAQAVCTAGTQPAVVSLRGRDFTNVWSCLPACPPRQEYVSQIRMPGTYAQTVEPKCERVCPAGWERKLFAAHAIGIEDIVSDICTAKSKTECQPVTEEAKADYDREHEQCESGRDIIAARAREANPLAACMSNCVSEARQCVRRCGRNPICVPDCQETTNACTAECHSATTTFRSSAAQQTPPSSPVPPPAPRGSGETVRHCVQNPDHNCSSKKFYCDVRRENLENPSSDTNDGHGNRICCWSHYHP